MSAGRIGALYTPLKPLDGSCDHVAGLEREGFGEVGNLLEQSKTISEVLESWRRSSLTKQRIRRFCGSPSSSAGIIPAGAPPQSALAQQLGQHDGVVVLFVAGGVEEGDGT